MEKKKIEENQKNSPIMQCTVQYIHVQIKKCNIL